MGKVPKWHWGHVVMKAIGSTCNMGKLTGKGQVKEKHRSKHMDIRN